MLIHTENNTNHYESTYAENNNMFFNRENIDTTVQSPELQCFLKVDFSLRWENLTNKTGFQDILKSKLSVLLFK